MRTPPPKPSILTKDWREWAERLVQWFADETMSASGVEVPKYPIARLPKAVGFGIIMVQDVASVYPAYSDGVTWRLFSNNAEVVP